MSLNKYLTDNNFEKKDLTILFSVGCVLNTENGDTFPMMEDDTFDFEDGMKETIDWFNVLTWVVFLPLMIFCSWYGVYKLVMWMMYG